MTTEESYWLMSTLGEACLLLDLVPEAEEFYGRAAQLGGERVGDVLSTWANARLILSLLPPSVYERIERALQVPKVAIFAGHRGRQRGQRRQISSSRMVRKIACAIVGGSEEHCGQASELREESSRFRFRINHRLALGISS